MSKAGLSPRLRGNRSAVPGTSQSHRSIPAPAGEPAAASSSSRFHWVYPRACGGTRCCLTAFSVVAGLSPRLRGNLGKAAHIGNPYGSIPAPAGEPAKGATRPVKVAVYPRACGGTKLKPGDSGWTDGLSPRLRGNHQARWHYPPCHRSIPAPAGEP